MPSMAKMRKSPEAELRASIRKIQEGIEEGKKLQTDKSQYHTLEEFPEPLEDPRKVIPKRGYKRTHTEAEIARIEKMKQMKHTNWLPGQSGNPAGRPTGSSNKYDPLKQIGMQLAFTNASLILTPKQRKLAKKLGYAPGDVKLIEALMIHLATSGNPNKIQLFLERTFGKVPNINIHAEYNASLVQRFSNKLTDSELEAIAEGADVLDILLSKLPDVDEVDNVHSMERMDNAVDGTVVDDNANNTQDKQDAK